MRKLATAEQIVRDAYMNTTAEMDRTKDVYGNSLLTTPTGYTFCIGDEYDDTDDAPHIGYTWATGYRAQSEDDFDDTFSAAGTVEDNAEQVARDAISEWIKTQERDQA